MDDTPEVRAVLTCLTVRQRSVIWLSYWADATDAEVADTLGVSVRTVERELRAGTAAPGKGVAMKSATPTIVREVLHRVDALSPPPPPIPEVCSGVDVVDVAGPSRRLGPRRWPVTVAAIVMSTLGLVGVIALVEQRNDTMSASQADRFFTRVEDAYRTYEAPAVGGSPESDAEFEHDVRACMSGQGIDYLAPASPVPVQPTSYTGDWWRRADRDLAERTAYGYTLFSPGSLGYSSGVAMVWYWTDAPPDYVALDDTARRDDDATLERCFDELLSDPAGYGQLVPESGIDQPAAAASDAPLDRLRDAMYDTILSDQFQPVVDAWRDCIARNGFPQALDDSWSAMDEAEAQANIVISRWPTPRQRSDVLAALNAERPPAVIDADCKYSLAPAIAAQLEPVFDEWTATL